MNKFLAINPVADAVDIAKDLAPVMPILDKLLGKEMFPLRTVQAELIENIPSQRGREEHVC